MDLEKIYTAELRNSSIQGKFGKKLRKISASQDLEKFHDNSELRKFLKFYLGTELRKFLKFYLGTELRKFLKVYLGTGLRKF